MLFIYAHSAEYIKTQERVLELRALEYINNNFWNGKKHTIEKLRCKKEMDWILEKYLEDIKVAVQETWPNMFFGQNHKHATNSPQTYGIENINLIAPSKKTEGNTLKRTSK